ncbi:hypothetical protein Cni_G21721 [Canna indica]|uniref:N-acetyltransferase domain-containing protein n=1 Tax=Canna indica TaxID=4628 RepID=A0AAQ3KSW8_9LILI|nr:hypothetical protein Cni_G21721 [Canna indica]
MAMTTTSLGLSSSPLASSPPFPCSPSSSPLRHYTFDFVLPTAWVSRGTSSHHTGGRFRSSPHSITHSIATGTCRASQAVDLFPSVWPEITVRDVRMEDYWEVADTHCSCFFPNYRFPINLLLRINRLVGLLSGFSVPEGSMSTCLVAVTGTPEDDNLYNESKNFKHGGFEGKFSFNKGYVAGILTVDTLADFLPRKGPLHQRRTGIAYISNVAVRKADRRKGIAKMLIAKAEARARSWCCRSMALHCDVKNKAAMRLYKGLGYKCIQVPENAKWPEPRTLPGTHFSFMMKLIN